MPLLWSPHRTSANVSTYYRETKTEQARLVYKEGKEGGRGGLTNSERYHKPFLLWICAYTDSMYARRRRRLE